MLGCLGRGVGVWMEQEAFRGQARRGACQKSVGISAGLVRNQMPLAEGQVLKGYSDFPGKHNPARGDSCQMLSLGPFCTP